MAASAFTDRVLDVLETLGTDVPMEEILRLCPELTWNQVFLAIDTLSRNGRLLVTLNPDRSYWVRASRVRVAASALAAASDSER